MGHPLNPSQLKTKVAEMTQSRLTPFTNGIPGNSWLKWFRLRNPHLVLRQPQSLDSNRARALCPSNVERFYTNLNAMYTQHKYQPSTIWNIDESGVQANRNGYTRVFASRGTRNVQCVVPNEKEHLTILSAISASGVSIPNYYIFKGKRASKTYIQLCEDGATIGMSKKGWMDNHLFAQWMDYFLNSLTTRGDFSPSQRHLLILDGHKSHISLQVLQKARTHGLDMISLPSHTIHALQPLDVACFAPFKKAFRTYRDMWMYQGVGDKVKKEHLAQWTSLALKKALTAQNIKARFQGCGIWPLNFEAMKSKMGPSKGFHKHTSNESQDDIFIQEIWEEDLPTPQVGALHYFVDQESSGDELPQFASTVDDHVQEEDLEDSSPHFSTFLRLPQEGIPRNRKTTCEPIVDYGQSQILTSSQHVHTLEDIASKKAQIQKDKEERAKNKELTKNVKAQEKIQKVAEKTARAATKEANKKFKGKWTTTAIEEAGEKLHEAIREGRPISDHIPYCGRQPWQCKWNQEIAILKLKAKRRRREEGLPVPKFPLPMQLPWFHGVQQELLQQGVPKRLLSPHAIPPWIFMTATPGTSLLQLSQNFSKVPVSPVLPFHNFVGTSMTIGGPHRSSSFTQWTGRRGCALEGRKAALGEAASKQTVDHGGGSKGTDSARGARFRKGLQQPPHRRRSADEHGDAVRGDSAIRR